MLIRTVHSMSRDSSAGAVQQLQRDVGGCHEATDTIVQFVCRHTRDLM